MKALGISASVCAIGNASAASIEDRLAAMEKSLQQLMVKQLQSHIAACRRNILYLY